MGVVAVVEEDSMDCVAEAPAVNFLPSVDT